jgi:hypothetical protein
MQSSMLHMWVSNGSGMWAYYGAHSSHSTSGSPIMGGKRDAQLRSQALGPDRAGYVYKWCGLCNIIFFPSPVQGGLEVGGERARSSPT